MRTGARIIAGAAGVALIANVMVVIAYANHTVTINSAPLSRTTATSAQFTYSSASDVSFSCSLDGAAGKACGSGPNGSVTYTNLAPGQHEFVVTAVRSRDLASDRHVWTIREGATPTPTPTAAPTSTATAGPTATATAAPSATAGPSPTPAAAASPPLLASGDDDGDGVRSRVDRCPRTPSGVRAVLRGCSAIEVLTGADALPETFGSEAAGLRKHLRRLPGVREETSLKRLRAGDAALDAARRALVSGDPCAAAGAATSARKAAVGLRSAIAEQARGRLRALSGRRKVGTEVDAPTIAYYNVVLLKRRAEQMKVAATSVAARLRAICRAVQDPNASVQGAVTAIDHARSIATIGGQAVVLAGSESTTAIGVGRELLAKGVRLDSGELVAVSVQALSVPPIRPAALSCVSLKLVPRTSFDQAANDTVIQLDPRGYLDGGTLRLEEGMGLALAPNASCQTEPAPNGEWLYGVTARMTYDDGVKHSDEVIATTDMGTIAHAVFPVTGAQPAQLTLEFSRAACDFITCTTPEDLGELVYDDVRVVRAGGYARLRLGGSGATLDFERTRAFALPEGVPGAFASGVTVRGFDYAGPVVKGITQVFARSVVDGKLGPLTALYPGEAIGIVDKPGGGIEAARVIGGRNGFDFIYDAEPQRIVTDAVRFCEDSAGRDIATFYRMPWVSPDKESIAQGNDGGFTHGGAQSFAYDFIMEDGEAIHAPRGGVVSLVEEGLTKTSNPTNVMNGTEEFEPANALVITHRDGTTGWFFHMPKNGVLPKVGDRVRRGEKVATVGNTGNSTTAHLHYHVQGENDDQSIKMVMEYKRNGKLFECDTPVKNPGYVTTNEVPPGN